MKQVLVILAILLISASASPDADSESFTTEINGITILQNVYNFTQRIDHFNSGYISTWQQRYVVYNEYFNPLNGTVFISIGGEAPMKGISTGRGWLLQLAKQFSAIVISVEHRFYGSSQPFGYSDSSYSLDNLKYLTADQALEDLAIFVQALKTNSTLVDLFQIGQRNPFITVGGSYPGALSAWFRAKYPHLTAGALASSAVVNSIINFPEYYIQVYLSTQEVNQLCPGNIQSFNEQVENWASLDDQTQINQLKAQLNATSLPNTEFLLYISDEQAGLVQYGNSVQLCSIFNTPVFSTSLTNFQNYLMNSEGYIPEPSGYTVSDLQNSTYSYSSNSRQWFYQVCTYYGWFATSSKNHQMISSSINLSYYLNLCSDVFGPEYLPSADMVNGYWGGLGIQATNIVFTNGSQDPWKWASLLESKGNITSIVTTCIGCAHGCELGIQEDDKYPEIIETQASVAALIQKWTTDHLSQYIFIQRTQQA